MKGKVLIVEDYADWRELISGLLRREGHDVEAVATLDDALEYINRTKDLDLAIIDIRLVETDEDNEDGMKLLAHIHEHHLFTRIIMITGHGTMESQRKAFKEYHAFDFFRKEQFSSDEFRKGFREAIELSARDRQEWKEKHYMNGRNYEMWKHESEGNQSGKKK